MPFYSVFGGCLDSDIAFPELFECAPRPAAWRFRTARSAGSGARSRSDWRPVGADTSCGCEIVLFRSTAGLVLRHGCTGIFEIQQCRKQIDWTPIGAPTWDAVRGDVLGRVLALAMHDTGQLALHASAVALEHGAVAFLGPKHHGKSTLAVALTRAGGHFLSDDILAITPGDPITVSVGVQSIRLRDDSADHLLRGENADRVGVDGKRVRDRFSGGSRAVNESPSPLAAIYILTPVSQIEDGSAAAREPLRPTHAALELLAQTKVGRLLAGSAEAEPLLDRVTQLARSVPVYRLRVVRDFARLPEAVTTVLDWHGATAGGRQS